MTSRFQPFELHVGIHGYLCANDDMEYVDFFDCDLAQALDENSHRFKVCSSCRCILYVRVELVPAQFSLVVVRKHMQSSVRMHWGTPCDDLPSCLQRVPNALIK
jgi:hypothetical protein